MMALAVVLASSCNKDENPKGSDNSKYVNTWVAENVKVSKVLEDLDGGDISEVLDNLPEALKNQAAQLMKLEVNAIVKLDENGKGNAGVLVNQPLLTAMGIVIKAIEGQGITIPSAVTEFLNKLKVNDYIGAPFTFVAAPEDATKGKLTFTVTVSGKAETTTADYKDLSDNAITVSYKDESESLTYTLKSLSSTKLTVGNFVDGTVLASLIPDTNE